MKNRLIEYWKNENIVTDKRVIEAFKKIPREKFILKEYIEEAYGDYPLSIGFGQTISQPTTVIIMTQALDVKPGNKVLEIGAGSGYQAALLSYLVGKNGIIYTTEIISELAEFARENLKECKIKNVKVLNIDGSQGYKKSMPYDRILVTAACPEIPEVLVKQLKNNGILLAPVGPMYGQEMLKIIKKGNKTETQNLGSFVFVKLKGKHGY